MTERAPGLWCWTAPHPEWAPGHGWDRDVWAYRVETRDAIVLIDPISPPHEDPQLEEHLATSDKTVLIVLSRAGHFREAPAFARRYGATIYGHVKTATRVPAGVEFRAIAPGDTLGDVRVLPFDVPDLDHTPLYIRSHRAIVPGDIVVRAEGNLRLWWIPENDDDVRFLHERHIPALREWLEFPIDHVLTSHGEPVIGRGSVELQAAITRPIWTVS